MTASGFHTILFFLYGFLYVRFVCTHIPYIPMAVVRSGHRPWQWCVQGTYNSTGSFFEFLPSATAGQETSSAFGAVLVAVSAILVSHRRFGQLRETPHELTTH